MEKLEKLHYENGVNDLEYISDAAEITKKVAIDFSLWQQRGECTWVLNDEDEWIDSYAGTRITTEELFDEFLKIYEI